MAVTPKKIRPPEPTVVHRGYVVWGARRGSDGWVYPTLRDAREAVLADQLAVRRSRPVHSPTSDRSIYLMGSDGCIYRFVQDSLPHEARVANQVLRRGLPVKIERARQ